MEIYELSLAETEIQSDMQRVPCPVCKQDYLQFMDSSEEEKQNYVACSCGLFLSVPPSQVSSLEVVRDILADAWTQHQYVLRSTLSQRSCHHQSAHLPLLLLTIICVIL